MRLTIRCDWCRKEFVKNTNKLRGIKHYCSRTCLGKANKERYALRRIRICDYCGVEFDYQGHHKKTNAHFFCSKKCAYEFKKNQLTVSCDWCGADITRKASAVFRFGPHNFCDRGCYQDFINFEKAGSKNQKVCGRVLYRALMEKKLGKKLTSDEEVHHIDGNHENNTMENIKVMSSSEHSKLHAAQKKRNIYGQFIATKQSS